MYIIYRMAERSINPKSLGKKSKDKILKKFSRTFQIPLENEADLIEWLRSTGVKTRKRKPENISKSMWSKQILYIGVKGKGIY